MREVIAERCRVDGGWLGERWQEGLDLRREREAIPVAEHVEGKDPEAVTSEEQPLPGSVVECERELSVQPVDEVRPELVVEGEQRLGVALGAKRVPGARSKLPVVEDLTVERHMEPIIDGCHRLG